MSPSPPAVLPATSSHTTHSIQHTFSIPKTIGLGVILSGGINREGGPHIYVDRILAGMDAAKVRPMYTLLRCVVLSSKPVANPLTSVDMS